MFYTYPDLSCRGIIQGRNQNSIIQHTGFWRAPWLQKDGVGWGGGGVGGVEEKMLRPEP